MKNFLLIFIFGSLFSIANAQSPKIDRCREAAHLIKVLWKTKPPEMEGVVNSAAIAPIDKRNIIGLFLLIYTIGVGTKLDPIELATNYYISCVNRE